MLTSGTIMLGTVTILDYNMISNGGTQKLMIKHSVTHMIILHTLQCTVNLKYSK